MTDWFHDARYSRDYRQVCAIAHDMTGRQCTLCNQDSDVLHHAQYASWWRLLADLWLILNGEKIKPPKWQPPGKEKAIAKLGGLTQGREVHGWSCFATCDDCHMRLIHRRRHWLEHRDRVKGCWGNRNRIWMLWYLRLMWRYRREQRGITKHGLWWLVLWGAGVRVWAIASALV